MDQQKTTKIMEINQTPMIGCHVGGGIWKEDHNAILSLTMVGGTLFQVFPCQAQGHFTKAPEKRYLTLLKEFKYILHAPLCFSLGKFPSLQRFKNFIQWINQYWLPEDGSQLKVVVHPLVYGPSVEIINTLVKAYQYINPSERIKICFENESGSAKKRTPTIDDLFRAKEICGSGICIDTEHLYAAGHNPENINYSKADVIHLNSIPNYVKFAGHLDRHSYTRLSDSKIGSNFIKHIFESMNLKTPIILERRDNDILMDDVNFLRDFEL